VSELGMAEAAANEGEGGAMALHIAVLRCVPRCLKDELCGHTYRRHHAVSFLWCDAIRRVAFVEW
jgi:hypothetical protein